jgi:hypothetical protein
MPITTTDFWNDLNKAITDIETSPECGDRDGIRQGTFIRPSHLLDHYSGLWPQIRQDAINDLARHAMLIHAETPRRWRTRHRERQLAPDRGDCFVAGGLGSGRAR